MTKGKGTYSKVSASKSNRRKSSKSTNDFVSYKQHPLDKHRIYGDSNSRLSQAEIDDAISTIKTMSNTWGWTTHIKERIHPLQTSYDILINTPNGYFATIKGINEYGISFEWGYDNRWVDMFPIYNQKHLKKALNDFWNDDYFKRR